MAPKKTVKRRYSSACVTRKTKKRPLAKRSSSEIPRRKQKLSTVSSHCHKNDEKVKILGIPIKSPTDSNDYKVIQLPNGLKAVLISYMPCIMTKEKIQLNQNCLDRRIEAFNRSVVGVEVRDNRRNQRPSTSCLSSFKASKTIPKRVHELNCTCENDHVFTLLSNFLVF